MTDRLIDALVSHFTPQMSLRQVSRFRDMLERFYAEQPPGGRLMQELCVAGLSEIVRSDFLEGITNDDVVNELIDHYVGVLHPHSRGNHHAVTIPLRRDGTRMSNEEGELAIHLYRTFREGQDALFPSVA